MEPLYCRNEADVTAAVLAILRGGNGGIWTAQATYGVTAIWGDEGKVTISGVMAIERNVEALNSETVEPSLTTTTTENKPEVVSTSRQTNRAFDEITTTRSAEGTTTETRAASTDEDRVSQPTETTITRTSGQDRSIDANVWVNAVGDDIQYP